MVKYSVMLDRTRFGYKFERSVHIFILFLMDALHSQDAVTFERLTNGYTLVLANVGTRRTDLTPSRISSRNTNFRSTIFTR